MHKKVTKQLHKRPAGAIQKKNKKGTKERIMNVALRQFSEHGFAGATVDDIVAAARVNKRMVYHYFGSKEGLYLAVLEEVFGQLAQLDELLFEFTGDPVEAIRKAVQIYFKFLKDHPRLVQILLWENLQKGKYITLIQGHVIKSPMLNYLKKIADAGIASGEFRKNLDIKHLLINLIGLCLVYFSNRYTLSRTVNLDLGDDAVLSEATRHVEELLIRGISTRPSQHMELKTVAKQARTE